MSYISLGAPVLKEQLSKLPVPAGTDTHKPIPHSDMWKMIESECGNFGFGLGDPLIGTSHGHLRMFGVVPINTGSICKGTTTFLILRNSHDKKFPASMGMGKQVNVCSNLMFGAEIILKTKHTKNVFKRISPMVGKAVARLAKLDEENSMRVEAYKNWDIPKIPFGGNGNGLQVWVDNFVCESLRTGIIASNKIESVLNEWANPYHEEFKPRTLWSLNNCFTQVLKKYKNPHEATVRGIKLTSLCDKAAGLDFSTEIELTDENYSGNDYLIEEVN